MCVVVWDMYGGGIQPGHMPRGALWGGARAGLYREVQHTRLQGHGQEFAARPVNPAGSGSPSSPCTVIPVCKALPY